MLAGAEEHVALLADWKPIVPVRNVTARKAQPHAEGSGMDNGSGDHGSIGLGAVLGGL